MQLYDFLIFFNLIRIHAFAKLFTTELQLILEVSDKKQITCNRFSEDFRYFRKSIPSGMHLSVEKDAVCSFPASCQDASLTRCRERKIVSASTERHIPIGM
jgi:hypothetical protein